MSSRAARRGGSAGAFAGLLLLALATFGCRDKVRVKIKVAVADAGPVVARDAGHAPDAGRAATSTRALERSP